MISKTQIKHIQALHTKKNREQENLFIIEGVKLVCEFIQSHRFTIKTLYALPDFINEYKDILIDKNIFFNEITDQDLKKISLQTTPNKVLAIVENKPLKLDTSILNTETSLYLDDIRDPGNLGTIVRIADWFGIKQVICSPTTTELYNPKTLQATMGAILRVNVVYISISELKKHYQAKPVYGAVLNGKNLYKETLTPGIIIIGNEANGISEDTMKYITQPITIPSAQNNGSESLNAANACAIICSEFHRQLYKY